MDGPAGFSDVTTLWKVHLMLVIAISKRDGIFGFDFGSLWRASGRLTNVKRVKRGRYALGRRASRA